MKTEEHYRKEIAIEIRRIMEMEGNKDATDKFWKALELINPKSCIVKIGWCSGEDISKVFDLFIVAYALIQRQFNQ